ncbi:hypothetical protein R3P38DRAFT_3342846 [Favolaschia claudopus]|uniref:RING-type domain-containing protein n=1 Tax=Favolaschia claudopus TaxID=2862362 RepID=A0AAW0DWY1_9AGAR
MSQSSQPPDGFRFILKPRQYDPVKRVWITNRNPNGTRKLQAIGPGSEATPICIDLDDDEDQSRCTLTSSLELYKNNIPPPNRQDCPSAFRCSICSFVYSHPVCLECRHTFCYACIRQAFVATLKCPICRENVSRPPVRAPRVLEDAIEEDNEAAGFTDKSIVDYSWSGLF